MVTQVEDTSETKTQILKKAGQLFAQRGYDGVSMREIAEACDITKANIYYYFKHKESLYLQVIESSMLELIDLLRRAARPDGTCREQITRVAETFMNLMRERRPLIQMSMRQFGGQEHEIRGLVLRYRSRMIEPIEQVLQRGVRSGELRALNIRMTAMTLMAMMGIQMNKYIHNIPVDMPEDETVPFIVALLFDGIRAR